MEHVISLLFRSIFVDNMIFAFFLGMCSYLAVSKTVKTSLGLGLAVTFVLTVTVPVNYLLQTKVLGPDCLVEGVDLSYLSFILFIAVIAGMVQLVVVAALVTIVSQILKAFAYDVSVQLSVYVGLIITNCILMGRLEAFAMQNKPWPSFLDGVGNGLGYAMILVIVGAVREFLGRGSLLGFQIIPDACYDFGYVNNGMMTMPAMALILVGCVIWVHRAYFYKEK